MSRQYFLHAPIGAGGMATVHIGQLIAPLGFSRVVAIKRLHPMLSGQPEFAAMLVDEARITARVRHLNVIPTLDVFVEAGECFLVMEYVEGESLAKLLHAASFAEKSVPPEVAVAVITGVLHGLHAAHTAKSARGEPLNIMHRDVSPQNILVGADGISRIFDFGVAKALGRLQQTRAGEFKGKLPYLAPELFGQVPPTQRVDIYAASVALWESLTTRRLFDGASEEEIFAKILQARVPAPSELAPRLPRGLDEVVLRGLSRFPEARFESAEQMAEALERLVRPAPPREVAAWMQSLAGEALAQRARLVSAIEGAAMPPALPPAPAWSASAEPLTTAPVCNTVPMLMWPQAPPVEPAFQDPLIWPQAPPVVEPVFQDRCDDEIRTIAVQVPLPHLGPEDRPRRRGAQRASIAIVALSFLLAAPAFGWMALSKPEPPQPRRIGKTAPLVVTSISPLAPASEPPARHEQLDPTKEAARLEQASRLESDRSDKRARPEPAAAKVSRRPDPEARPRKRSERSKPAGDDLDSSAFTNRK